MRKPPALLLLGIQNDHFPGGLAPLEGMEAVAANAARMLEVFRRRDWPRFHVQHVSTRAGATYFLPGTCGVEIHESVAPTEDEPVVIKHFPNAFRETMLFDELWQVSAGRVVVCGATSNVCIDSAVRHAVDFGLPATVVHDACAARAVSFGGRAVPAAEVHVAFMASLAGYARVCTREEWERNLEPAALAA